LNVDASRIKALGMDGMMQPLKTTCNDHEGARKARIHTWDGKAWSFTSDWYEADNKMLRPMVEAQAKKYAAEKKIEVRDCSKET
jgi:branched-chain amino acid transport system substrate-binding protein